MSDISLYVELEVHDVTVLHHVLLTLLAQLAGGTAPGLSPQLDVIIVTASLGLDEATLEVGVDDAGPPVVPWRRWAPSMP